MTNLAILLGEIKTSLYALLAAFLCLIAAASFLAWRSAPDERMQMTCRVLDTRPRISATDWPAFARGHEMFVANCASCHNKNMKDKLTGPALGGTTERWSKFPPQDLYQYIRHSQAMTKAKHPRARQLWKAYQPTVMNDFSTLTDRDIEAILLYIRGQRPAY